MLSQQIVAICASEAWTEDALYDFVRRAHPYRELPRRDFDAVLGWILRFRKGLGIPHTLGELGVKEADAGAIAADAVKDPTAGSNPRRLSAADFERVILAAIRGDIGA